VFNVHKSWFRWLFKEFSEVAPQTFLDVAFGPLSEMLGNHWYNMTDALCCVATGPWKSLKVCEKKIPFLQDLKSPWKQNRAWKVLEFDINGPWSCWVSVLNNHRYYVVIILQSALNLNWLPNPALYTSGFSYWIAGLLNCCYLLLFQYLCNCYVTAVSIATLVLLTISWCHKHKTSLE